MPKKIFDIIPPKRKRTRPAKTFKKSSRHKPIFSFINKKVLLKKIAIPIVFLLVFLVVFFHLSAKAEIEIWPKIEKFSAEKEILIDANVSQSDFSKKVIAGTLLSKEKTKSQEFNSTGFSEKKQKASGTIRVYNNYHLNQILVETTRFVSADAKLFRSIEGINIPSGQFVDVNVVAAEPGPEYNIKPTKFSIPGLLGSPRYTMVHGESLASMTGGSAGQAAQITEQDLEKAQNELEQELINLVKEELKGEAGPNFLVADRAIEYEILESSCSQGIGDEAEKFTCFLKIKAETLGFLESVLKDFAQKFIEQEMGESKLIKPDSLNISPIAKEIDLKNKKTFLDLKISTDVYLEIDINSLKQGLREKSLKESEILLQNYPMLEKTKIKLFPFWIKTVPSDLEKIKIEIRVDSHTFPK